ncbi:MAG: hypothetical protein L0228_16135 [Planctomycetes bacterium]|nr:hypothetical protein [Planctomycetota bacterium]
MTQLLQQAIAELHKLPESDQDAIASLILAELADEHRWSTAFENSQEQLSRMADKVREDIRARRVRDMGIDEL